MILVLLLILLLPVSAQALTPMDFAGGYALEASPGFALQRLELPLEAYGACSRADLGDLRVFNAAGEEVPALVRRVAPKTAASVGLPLFRLGNAGGGRDYDFRLQVRTSERGAVVETRVSPPGEEERLLLLDATGLASQPGALRFTLGSGPKLLRVSVRGSNDLGSWHAAGAGVLARMEHQNGRVLQDRVILSGRAWKYYLVSGMQNLSGIEAVSAEPGTGPALRRFTSLSGTMVEEGVYEYALPAGLPVDLLDLEPADNAVLGVEVRAPAGDGWKRVAAGTLFRLTVDGQPLVGAGLPLRGPLPKFRIAMQGAPAPLRVGWVPHELVFMAQGEGPFTLALGNPGVQAGPDLLGSMLSSEGMGGTPMGTAELGAWKSLGGEERLRPARSYTKMLLWAVLGLGVAMLGAMAWHLARNME